MNPGDNYSPTSQRNAVIHVSDIQKNAKIVGVYTSIQQLHKTGVCGSGQSNVTKTKVAII